MKLIFLRSNLVDGLHANERVVTGNANLPILKHVLIKAADGKIVFVGTDLELGIETTTPGKIVEEGTLAVPFGILGAIVKNLTEERVTLETKATKLSVTTDNYEATIQGADAKEFPIIPSVRDSSNLITVNGKAFHEALSRVVTATQFSDLRPEISGVFLSYSEEKLVLAATDSFRLAEYTLAPSSARSTLDSISGIIPLKTTEETLRMLEREDGDVQLFFDSLQIAIHTPTKKIISRLIDGTFPDYRSIIPKSTAIEVTVQRDEFLSAIKLVSSFSSKAHELTVKCGENKKFLELYSSDSLLGENTYRIPAKTKGDTFSVVFNWRYLADGLKIYSAKEVVVGINAANKPALIQSISESFLIYVLMPIKT